MDIKKLVPIDFSRKITPFVAGDSYWNDFVKVEITMDEQEAKEFNDQNFVDFSTYFIISYADRPNTGKQPVDDDVIVDLTLAGGEFNGHEAKLGTFRLKTSTPTSSCTYWKPNHAAMVEMYQASLAKTEDYKPTSNDLQLQRLVDFIFANNLILDGENPVDCVIRELAEKHDIDMRSDKEKLRDAIERVLTEKGELHDEYTIAEGVATDLLASDRFTITLNK